MCVREVPFQMKFIVSTRQRYLNLYYRVFSAEIETSLIVWSEYLWYAVQLYILSINNYYYEKKVNDEHFIM